MASPPGARVRWVVLQALCCWLGVFVGGVPMPKVHSKSPWRIAPVDPALTDSTLVIHNGDVIFLRHMQSKKIVDVHGVYLKARMNGHGTRQAFKIEKPETGAVCGNIYAFDRVYLTAHTGMRVGVDGEVVTAGNKFRGPRQELLLEVLNPTPGPLRHGAVVFLRAHTGKHIEIFGDVAKARFDKRGAAQAFVIEKPRSSY
mmetsp:Transcript_95426/g.274858  ORF Transcript_95426/g.274858 Transcript_95426/m.274858 type:complete len:200 (+) Transcript_95426:31-630(+)